MTGENTQPDNFQSIVVSRIKEGYGALEVARLHRAIGTATDLGAGFLLGDFALDLPHSQVVKRQQASQELEDSPQLLSDITSVLSELTENEEGLLKFVDGGRLQYKDEYPRSVFNGARSAIKTINKLADLEVADVESVLLQDVFANLREFKKSESSKLSKGKVYITPQGIKPYDSSWRWALPLRLGYRGIPMTGRLLATTGLAFYISKKYFGPKYGIDPVTNEQVPEINDFGIMLALTPLMLSFGTFISNTAADAIHEPMFIRPVRRKLQKDPLIKGALRSYAELDVLRGFAQYAKTVRENGHKVVYPEFDLDNTQHVFMAKGLKNPLLAYERSVGEVVPNDVDLQGLTMLTGPNSGGKSTAVKAILQSQLLAQAGGPVVAEQLKLSRADIVHHMVPGAPNLDAQIGRFGYELTQLKVIFDSITPNSLVGLDDCMDGTTHQERLVTLGAAMRGFNSIGANVIFSTHASELVQEFADSEIGQQLQVEFVGDRPTHHIIPGVSHTSHADRVARLVGMDEESIDNSLRVRGYR